jgi:hypothetical protein
MFGARYDCWLLQAQDRDTAGERLSQAVGATSLRFSGG